MGAPIQIMAVSLVAISISVALTLILLRPVSIKPFYDVSVLVFEATAVVVEHQVQLLPMKVTATAGAAAGNDDDADMIQRNLLQILALLPELLSLPVLQPQSAAARR